MNNTSKILSVSDLIVDFPVFGGILQKEIDQVHAVKKVSFELYKGETLGIVGESGSGKSTLGNAILNVLRLTCLLYTSPSPRDKRQSRMPSSA